MAILLQRKKCYHAVSNRTAGMRLELAKKRPKRGKREAKFSASVAWNISKICKNPFMGTFLEFKMVIFDLFIRVFKNSSVIFDFQLYVWNKSCQKRHFKQY